MIISYLLALCAGNLNIDEEQLLATVRENYIYAPSDQVWNSATFDRLIYLADPQRAIILDIDYSYLKKSYPHLLSDFAKGDLAVVETLQAIISNRIEQIKRIADNFLSGDLLLDGHYYRLFNVDRSPFLSLEQFNEYWISFFYQLLFEVRAQVELEGHKVSIKNTLRQKIDSVISQLSVLDVDILTDAVVTSLDSSHFYRKKKEERALKADPFVKAILLSVVGSEHILGMVEIPSFYEGSSSHFHQELARLKIHSVEGLIIDLRGNRDGYWTEMLRILSIFLQRGFPLYQTIYRTPSAQLASRVEINQQEQSYFNDLIILLDEQSSSLAELMGLVLQQYRRAVIVGVPTAGDNALKTIFAIKNREDRVISHMGITTELFYSLDGQSIAVRGVFPDIYIRSSYRWGKVVKSSRREVLETPMTKVIDFPKMNLPVDYLNNLSRKRREGDDRWRAIAHAQLLIKDAGPLDYAHFYASYREGQILRDEVDRGIIYYLNLDCDYLHTSLKNYLEDKIVLERETIRYCSGKSKDLLLEEASNILIDLLDVQE